MSKHYKCEYCTYNHIDKICPLEQALSSYMKRIVGNFMEEVVGNEFDCPSGHILSI